MIPDGYIPAISRQAAKGPKRSHLFKGTFKDPGLPMCGWGYSRYSIGYYSIFRNDIGEKGICKICMRRAKKGLDGVEDRRKEV